MSINRHTEGAAASWRSISLAGLHGGYMLSLSQSGCSTCFKHLYRAGRQSAIWALQAARRGPNPGPSFTVRNLTHVPAFDLKEISTAPKNKIDNYSKTMRKMSVNSIGDVNGIFLGFVLVFFVFLAQASRHKQHGQKRSPARSVSKLPLSTRYKSSGGNGPAHPAAQQVYLW